MAKKIRSKKTGNSLWNKIWKSLVALGVFFGFLGPTGIKLSIWLVLGIIGAVVVLVLYWHLLKWLSDTINQIKHFFIDLKADVKFIRNNIQKGGKNDKIR